MCFPGQLFLFLFPLLLGLGCRQGLLVCCERVLCLFVVVCCFVVGFCCYMVLGCFFVCFVFLLFLVEYRICTLWRSVLLFYRCYILHLAVVKVSFYEFVAAFPAVWYFVVVRWCWEYASSLHLLSLFLYEVDS